MTKKRDENVIEGILEQKANIIGVRTGLCEAPRMGPTEPVNFLFAEVSVAYQNIFVTAHPSFLLPKGTGMTGEQLQIFLIEPGFVG